MRDPGLGVDLCHVGSAIIDHVQSSFHGELRSDVVWLPQWHVKRFVADLVNDAIVQHSSCRRASYYSPMDIRHWRSTFGRLYHMIRVDERPREDA